MPSKGLLKFAEFGRMMPVTDPYVPGPPSWMKGESFKISFTMDYDSVAHRLPEPLEFLSDPPTGALHCSNMQFVSDSSSFLEASLVYHVQYQGKPFNYMANLFVSEVEALVAGREVYGYPKKFAYLDYYKDQGQICMTAERPRGFPIFKAAVRTKQPKQPESSYRDVLLLKVIPSPISGDPPQVCQLVGLPTNMGPTEVADTWQCSASITWGVNSAEDPWWETKIISITDAYYSRRNEYALLDSGYIVYDYLKERYSREGYSTAINV